MKHSSVTVDLPEEPRSRFVRMVRQEAIYVEFSGATALPIGEFEAGGFVFYWHGNAVAQGGKRKGRMWTSPLMLALINRATSFPENEQD